MSQARVIPAPEAGFVTDEKIEVPPPATPATKTDVNASDNKGTRFSLEQGPMILRSRRFTARSRSVLKRGTTQVKAISLHGYSSLRMIHDGPQACKEKVHTKI